MRPNTSHAIGKGVTQQHTRCTRRPRMHHGHRAPRRARGQAGGHGGAQQNPAEGPVQREGGSGHTEAEPGPDPGCSPGSHNCYILSFMRKGFGRWVGGWGGQNGGGTKAHVQGGGGCGCRCTRRSRHIGGHRTAVPAAADKRLQLRPQAGKLSAKTPPSMHVRWLRKSAASSV